MALRVRGTDHCSRGRYIHRDTNFPGGGTLFDVVECAAWRLGPDKLQAYLARVTDKLRHEDVLVEFAPVLRLDDTITVQHEVAGTSERGTTVDWSIQAPGQPMLLLEVKNRMFDLIESFERIKRQGADDAVPSPQHDHKWLFRRVAHKFKTRQPNQAIQAAWINTGLKQEELEFQAAFWTCPHF